MTRLISPNGVLVSVSDERAVRLCSDGYRLAPDRPDPSEPVVIPKKRTRAVVIPQKRPDAKES